MSRTPAHALLLGACLAVLLGFAACGTGAPVSPTASATASATVDPRLSAWESTVAALRWVAYSPTNANPDAGLEPTEASLREDLTVLRSAGFTGLVTYGSTGIVGRRLPYLAEELGFRGLLVGVWDPGNGDELASATAVAASPVVLGYVVGNEGLDQRYTLSEVTSAMDALRRAAGKPVTTTEQIDDYRDADLLAAGDWVFPNAHPYFQNLTDPHLAADWTSREFDDLSRRAGRFVLFKEVGLPTAGADGLSEESQRDYYQALALTPTRFVYFEAFDMTWKTHLPVEPHWGLFRSDRTPKLLAASLSNR